ARTRGDRPAVTLGAETWTYAELDRRANQIAHHLRGRGLASGEPVAVVLERSPLQVAALLGAIKAGGCYLPLDARHPEARIRAVLAGSGARFLIGRGAALARFDGAAELIDATAIDGPSSPCGVEVQPDDAMYLIYTSGTTGVPKGVVVTHRQ